MSTQLEYFLIVLIMLGFTGMEFFTRRYQKSVSPNADVNDAKLELMVWMSLIAVVIPLTLVVTDKLGNWLLPTQRNALASMPAWAMVGILLVGDDMTQYWWHRLSHTPLLWPLHRAHHSAKYMSVRITYRNNFFYYLMMPGLWLSAALAYLGFGKVYAFYQLAKITVIIGSHCAWRWDEPLYRIRALHPLMWLLERTISTPATHWAHHALTNSDGIGYYTGNYGNLLFFWDILFGTAHITRQFPPKVGLADDLLFGDEEWKTQMLYPLRQSTRECSALHFGGKIFDEMKNAEDAQRVAETR